MKKLNLLIFLFVFFSCVNKSDNNVYKPKTDIEVKREIQIFMSRLPSEPKISINQFSENKNFKKLLGKYTNQDLVILTDYNDPLIRCSSFKSLAERNYPKIKEIFFTHIHDNDTVEIRSNDMFLPVPTKSYMLNQLHPLSKCKYKFSRKEYDELFKELEKN